MVAYIRRNLKKGGNMKRILFITVVIIFTAMSFAVAAMPTSYGYHGVTPMSGLSADEAQANVQIAMEKGKAISEEDKILYNPDVIYPGIYETKRLYYNGHGSDSWKGISKPAFLEDVTCIDAKRTLSISGLWKGALNKNGSCGIAEGPTEWTAGNYLNFQLTPDSATE